MVHIIPSLLVPDETTFLKNVRGLEDAVDMIQIDIADGKFVPSVTWADPAVVAEHVPFACELHLMVADPLTEISKWKNVSQVKRILVHYESTDLSAIMPELLAYGWEVGIVLNPATPLSILAPFMTSLHNVMFMGVTPGRQGNPYMPETPSRVAAFREQYPSCFIEVDGGVNEKTVPDLFRAGADAVCPGSAIFGNERTPAENVASMREMIQRLTE